MSFTHPHDPFVCSQEDWDLYDGVDIPLPHVPEVGADDPQTINSIALLGMADVTFTEEQISAARRGYYGSISYIDRKIGEVLSAIQSSDLRDNTIVALTSDHGEMLGEHGLWMKRSFMEPALKVPLIFHAPALFGSARIDALVSLVDLLPTFVGFATDGEGEYVEQLDGADLSRAIMGTEPAPDRPLLAELTCEGTPAPVAMVRRGSFKYTCSPAYPPRLHDLSTDPHETTNLSGKPEFAEIEVILAADVAAEWQFDSLSHDIRLSQRRRHLVQQAHTTTGEKPDWDYRESTNPDDRWMRSGVSYNDWAYGKIEVLG